MSGERGPIFIGGLAHSGKTPVRMVLGAHPDISMTRHTHLWDRFFGRFGDLADPRNLDRCLDAMFADDGVRRLDPDPIRIRRELLGGPVTYARVFGVLHRLHAERLGKRRWGDQLGFVERFADPIFAEFPTARMIHMIRDPRLGLEGDGRRRPGAVGWQTAKWLASAELAERNLRRYPGRYRMVRYESLAEAPADTLRDLCRFLGEDYTASMARALATIRVERTSSVGLTGDHRARPVRRPAGFAFVDRYARGDLRAFDYPPAQIFLTARERLYFAMVDRPVNRASMAAWWLLEGRSLTKQGRG